MAKKRSIKEELKETKEDLTDLEMYIKEFSTFLPLAVCTLNPVERIIDVNTSFESLTGYKSIEIVGESIEKIFLSKEIKEILKEVQEKKYIKREEISLITRERKKFSVSISISTREDGQGNFIGYFIGIIDISEVKKLQEGMEKKIRERTKELEHSRTALLNILEDVEEARSLAEEERDKTVAIIENFPEGLLFFDGENRLSSINPKAQDFFEIEPEGLIGKNTKELREVSNLFSLIKILGEEIKTIYRKELTLKENLVLEISTISVVREEEKIGTLVVLRNVTREKIIEKLKTEFVSITAHQLRTPLSAIKWTLRMILDGDVGKIAEQQKELLAKTYQSNERMIKLINDLLNVTRIEEGRFLYNVQKQDMIKIVKKVIIPLKEMAQRKGLKFELEIAKEKIPKVELDREKISLVIQNLVDNAIHYTKSGEIKVSLKYLKKEKQILFSVKDTGIGIPRGQQDRVFTRFFRAANAIRAETEGTGLGLFISKNIIKAHEGRIWFESNKDKGTTFFLTLPVKEKEFEKFIEGF